jgi:hypothetical protein
MQLGLQFFSFHGNKKTDGSSLACILNFKSKTITPPQKKKMAG